MLGSRRRRSHGRASVVSLTFGLLASEAAGVVLLLPLGSRRAGGLQPRRVLELLCARHLLVDVVGKVPHDADAVLHRLQRARGRRRVGHVRCQSFGRWRFSQRRSTLLSMSFFPTADWRACSSASTKPPHSLSRRRASAPSELTFLKEWRFEMRPALYQQQVTQAFRAAEQMKAGYLEFVPSDRERCAVKDPEAASGSGRLEGGSSSERENRNPEESE